MRPSSLSAAGPSDPQVTESFRTICKLEAEELKQESYGVDLLHAVGFGYAEKGKQYLASNQTFLGMGGWLHNVQGKYHVFSETYVHGVCGPSKAPLLTMFGTGCRRCELRWSSRTSSSRSRLQRRPETSPQKRSGDWRSKRRRRVSRRSSRQVITSSALD